MPARPNLDGHGLSSTDADEVGGNEMEAGRELDALVAEKVMGMDVDKARHARFRFENGIKLYLPVPAYSTDTAAAMNVLGRMRADGWFFSLNDRNGEESKPFWAEFASENFERGGQAWEATLPHAICLAALKAIEE